MTVEWNFTAQTYLDQLPPEEGARVERSIRHLEKEWDQLLGGRLSRLEPSALGTDLYSLRVGHDLRVILQRYQDTIIVLDVVRSGQIEGLRDLSRLRRAEAG